MPAAHHALPRAYADNDGYATVEEVTEHLKEQGIDVNAKNVQAFIQRFDKDKDGKIKLEEFVDEILVSPLANAVGASLTAAIERAFVEVEEDVALQDVRRELLEEFEMFAEGDRMSRANVERVLRAQGVDLTDEEMGEICTKAKVDDSGVDRDTWLFVAIQAFLKTRGGGIQGDSAFREAKRAFSIFDINDDGFVVASELEHILLQEVELGSSMAGDRKVEVTK